MENAFSLLLPFYSNFAKSGKLTFGIDHKRLALIQLTISSRYLRFSLGKSDGQHSLQVVLPLHSALERAAQQVKNSLLNYYIDAQPLYVVIADKGVLLFPQTLANMFSRMVKLSSSRSIFQNFVIPYKRGIQRAIHCGRVSMYTADRAKGEIQNMDVLHLFSRGTSSFGKKGTANFAKYQVSNVTRLDTFQRSPSIKSPLNLNDLEQLSNAYPFKLKET